MGKEKLIDDLEKLADEKTAVTREAAEKEAERHRNSLDRIRDLSDNGPFAEGLTTLIERLEPPTDELIFGIESPASIRNALIQYCQLCKPFPYERWYVVDAPDEAASDEQNLVVTRCETQAKIDSFEDCEKRNQELQDVLWMLGKLARNIQSPILPRILQLMVDFEPLHGWRGWFPEEKAKRLVDELILCWKLVMKETSLCDADDNKDIWPKRPRHEERKEYDNLDVSGMDAEVATAASRSAAWNDYRREFKDLLPPENGEEPEDDEGIYDTRPAMIRLTESVKRLADETEKGEPSTDERFSHIEYDLLERVLGANTRLTYESYYEKEGEEDLSSDYTFEPTTLNNQREQVVADLNRYLEAAYKLAKRCSSESCKDWEQCRLLIELHRGKFFDDFPEEKRKAAKNLKTFMDCLKRARKQLWTDFSNYTPPPKNAEKDPNASPEKIGKGFPFITYCDPDKETLRMRVKQANGTDTEFTFKISGKERWHYVLQFVKAKTTRVTLKPFAKDKPINLSLVFRDMKGYDHRKFYAFTRTTKGSKAQYWLEQTQQKTKNKQPSQNPTK